MVSKNSTLVNFKVKAEEKLQMFEKLAFVKKEKIKEISIELERTQKNLKCSTMVQQNWTKSCLMVKVLEIDMDWASR